jgi:NAD(P)-dependent dehydrogenase (short-subunit alcohol dehydrogenase family)
MSSPHPIDRPALLITGASSGIGAACALELADRKFRVFVGVRKMEDAQRLQSRSGGELLPLLLDVTDAEAIGAAAAQVAAAVGTAGLAGLVCNAGIAVPGPLELLPTSDFRRQLEVNVLGTHAVIQAMLPLLRIARGRIVIVGSISGFITPPCFGAYAASKHALEAVADALRMELRDAHIAVSIVEPDVVATPIWDKLDRAAAELGGGDGYADDMAAVRKASARNRSGAMPASRVVAAVRHALCSRRPKTHYPVGFRTRLARWARGWLPARIMDWLLVKFK